EGRASGSGYSTDGDDRQDLAHSVSRRRKDPASTAEAWDRCGRIRRPRDAAPRWQPSSHDADGPLQRAGTDIRRDDQSDRRTRAGRAGAATSRSRRSPRYLDRVDEGGNGARRPGDEGAHGRGGRDGRSPHEGGAEGLGRAIAETADRNGG